MDNWAGKETSILNTRWKHKFSDFSSAIFISKNILTFPSWTVHSNSKFSDFPSKILTFQDKCLDFSSTPFPLISNNKYSDFSSAIYSFLKTNVQIFHQHYSFLQNNFKTNAYFLYTISSVSYDKSSHFASALLTSEAKAHIFHQHRPSQKQNAHFFHFLVAKMLKINTQNIHITIRLSPFIQYPSTVLQLKPKISLPIR